MGLELESFYSDLASLESAETSTTVLKPEPPAKKPVKRDAPIVSTAADDAAKIPKKKKKSKVTTLNAKLNDISGMVAKWQKVQKDLDS